MDMCYNMIISDMYGIPEEISSIVLSVQKFANDRYYNHKAIYIYCEFSVCLNILAHGWRWSAVESVSLSVCHTGFAV